MSTDLQRQTAEKVKQHVQESFDHIRKALDIREKLLLRQYGLLLSQSHKISSIDDIKFLRENENDLMNSIRAFGRFNINHNIINRNELFSNEDYISPNNDHDILLKCLKSDERKERKSINNQKNLNNLSNSGGTGTVDVVAIDQITSPTTCAKNKLNDDNIDFMRNKNFLKENADLLNESIINITLNESKELIDKTANDGCHGKRKKFTGGSGIAFSSLPLANDDNKMPVPAPPQQSSKSSKPTTTTTNDDDGMDENGGSYKNISNLTINNCTGNIHLKNISNLTINTCKKNLYPSMTEDIECDFYNRLLTDTKLLKSPKQMTSTTAHLILLSKDIELKRNNRLNNNFIEAKNLKSILSGETETFQHLDQQVQQWLKHLRNIYETEMEPAQTIEILEHSTIDTK